jgi:hypothetical protein
MFSEFDLYAYKTIYDDFKTEYYSWDMYGFTIYDSESGEDVSLSEFVEYDYAGVFDDLFSDLDIDVVNVGDPESDCDFMMSYMFVISIQL